jgi:F-type H+-transporting ATPase subunit b
MLNKIHIRIHFFSIVLLVIFPLFLFSPAAAVENGHSADNKSVQTAVKETGHEARNGENRRGDLTDLLYRFENFALLVLIIFVFRKEILRLMGPPSARREEIKHRLLDLKRDKEDAEIKCREAESRLKDFEIKTKEIIDQYKKEGLAEKEKIISDAKEKARQLIVQSEMAIRQEMESARHRLRQEIVELAAQRALEIISREMDERDDDNLINEFIEKVAEAN